MMYWNLKIRTRRDYKKIRILKSLCLPRKTKTLNTYNKSFRVLLVVFLKVIMPKSMKFREYIWKHKKYKNIKIITLSIEHKLIIINSQIPDSWV